MVQRFLPFQRGVDADLDIILYFLLADVLAQRLRPKALLVGFFFRADYGCHQRVGQFMLNHNSGPVLAGQPAQSVS